MTHSEEVNAHQNANIAIALDESSSRTFDSMFTNKNRERDFTSTSQFAGATGIFSLRITCANICLFTERTAQRMERLIEALKNLEKGEGES